MIGASTITQQVVKNLLLTDEVSLERKFKEMILAIRIENILNKEQILDNIKLIFILGITSITVFNSIVYYSLNFTNVISGVLMISTIPVMIIFFSWIFKIPGIIWREYKIQEKKEIYT